MARKNLMSTSLRPVGITIISVLMYIGTALLLLSGIGIIIGSTTLLALLSRISGVSAMGVLGSTGLIIAGIIMIAFAVLYFLLTRGLWKGRNWARIAVLVLSILGLLSSIFPPNIMGIALNGVIIWYLGFNKNAKNYCS